MMTLSMPQPRNMPEPRNQAVPRIAPGTQEKRLGRLLTFPASISCGVEADNSPRDVSPVGGGEGATLSCPGPIWPAERPGNLNRRAKPLVQGKSTPVPDALQACRTALRSAAGASVLVHVSSESGLRPLALDDRSLERVLLHLVKNAAEAMPKGGAVHIVARRALSRNNPAVLFHISDDGPGIPVWALEHIFKPGFSSKRDTRGWGDRCGLGLAIVRDLVQDVGGSVEVASTRRRGTTFELRIPSALKA